MCVADVGRRPAAWYSSLLPMVLEIIFIRRNLMGQLKTEDALLGAFFFVVEREGIPALVRFRRVFFTHC